LESDADTERRRREDAVRQAAGREKTSNATSVLFNPSKPSDKFLNTFEQNLTAVEEMNTDEL
jgi:hypothetical protein